MSWENRQSKLYKEIRAATKKKKKNTAKAKTGKSDMEGKVINQKKEMTVVAVSTICPTVQCHEVFLNVHSSWCFGKQMHNSLYIHP